MASTTFILSTTTRSSEGSGLKGDATEWTIRLWSALNKFFLRWLEEAKRETGIEP